MGKVQQLIICVPNMNLDHYLCPDWPAPSSVKAFSTTRYVRGYSKPPFDQFNLSLDVNDDPAAVLQNRQQLIQDLQLPQAPVWLQQEHGIRAVCLGPDSKNFCADAAYTQQSNKVCTIITADCVPILLCDQQGKEVAAIHAGWRNLLSGVIESTILAMDSPPAQLLAWIGPAIGPDHFEINEDIRAQFLTKNTDFNPSFTLLYPKRWFADLFSLTHFTLQQCGISSIYGGGLCTYKDTRFYSYRRDQRTTGRMASLIWISSEQIGRNKRSF